MAKFKVKTTKDHILRIGKTSPVDALSEIIWNSFDAGAKKVQIDIKRNELSAIEEISVKDDGAGFQQIFVEQLFGDLGTSTKQIGALNPRGKPLHGKLGEGRFKAYSLGTAVKWITKFEGQPPFIISGNYQLPEQFDVSDYKEIFVGSCGTHFIAENGYEELPLVEDEQLVIKLSELFAPKLLAEPDLSIKVGNLLVDPTANIEERIPFERNENPARPFKGSIVFWRKGKTRDISWCEAGLIPRCTEPKESRLAKTFSIFVESPVITRLITESAHILPQAMAPELYHEVHTHVDELLEEYAAKKVAETVKELKERNVYPYEREPHTVTERLERQVFDVCTAKIVESIPSVATASRDSQKLTFGLLKEAIETSPKTVKKILEKVLKLPVADIEELSKLLDKVSLEGLIKLGRYLSDRLDFIEGFSQLVFETEWKKHVKERKHLQKILEGETWIFGDEFSIGTADQNLDNVLKYHLGVLKHSEEEIQEMVETGPRLNTIPDLVFGRQFYSRSGDQVEHLVIEIKRPSVKIGLDEKGQIERYASLVCNDSRFNKDKTKWYFYVISTDIQEELKPYLSQQNMAPGQIASIANGRANVYMKTWGDIIHNAKGRLAHLKQSLDLQPSAMQGLQYLREKFPTIIDDIESSAVGKMSGIDEESTIVIKETVETETK